jgi:hypothetical protein
VRVSLACLLSVGQLEISFLREHSKSRLQYPGISVALFWKQPGKKIQPHLSRWEQNSDTQVTVVYREEAGLQDTSSCRSQQHCYVHATRTQSLKLSGDPCAGPLLYMSRKGIGKFSSRRSSSRLWKLMAQHFTSLGHFGWKLNRPDIRKMPSFESWTPFPASVQLRNGTWIQHCQWYWPCATDVDNIDNIKWLRKLGLWPWHSLDDLSPASHSSDRSSITGQVMWDIWWTK